jgi:hypothetical protein
MIIWYIFPHCTKKYLATLEWRRRVSFEDGFLLWLSSSG